MTELFNGGGTYITSDDEEAQVLPVMKTHCSVKIWVNVEKPRTAELY